MMMGSDNGKDVAVLDGTEIPTDAPGNSFQDEVDELDFADDCHASKGDTGKLLLREFESIAGKHEEASSALNFIKWYYEEDADIDPMFCREYKDLKILVDHVWKIVYCDIIRTTCERCMDKAADHNTKLMSCCCLAEKLLDRDDDDCFLGLFTLRSKDMISIGKDFASNEKFFHSVISYYATTKLHKLSNRGNESVNGIQTCMWLMTFNAERIAKREQARVVVTNHVIPLMHDMMKFLKSVRSANHKHRAESEAWCLIRISLAYHYVGNEDECLNICESAIALLNKKFKKEPWSLQVYGACLNNVAAAYERLGNNEKAQQLFVMATESCEKATDWCCEAEKEAAMKLVRDNQKSRKC